MLPAGKAATSPRALHLARVLGSQVILRVSDEKLKTGRMEATMRVNGALTDFQVVGEYARGDHAAPAQPLDYLKQAIRPPHHASLAPRHLATPKPVDRCRRNLSSPGDRRQWLATANVHTNVVVVLASSYVSFDQTWPICLLTR
jgi:hypothetical protein